MKYCCEKVLLEKVLLNQLKHDKDNFTIKKFSNICNLSFKSYLESLNCTL